MFNPLLVLFCVHVSFLVPSFSLFEKGAIIVLYIVSVEPAEKLN